MSKEYENIIRQLWLGDDVVERNNGFVCYNARADYATPIPDIDILENMLRQLSGVVYMSLDTTQRLRCYIIHLRRRSLNFSIFQ